MTHGRSRSRTSARSTARDLHADLVVDARHLHRWWRPRSLYACWRFRDRPGAPIPKQVHGHTVLEISWTIAFAVILLIIAHPDHPGDLQDPGGARGHRAAGRRRGQAVVVGVPLPASSRSSPPTSCTCPPGRRSPSTCTRPTSSTPSGCPQLGGKRDVVPHRVNQHHAHPRGARRVPGPVRRVLRHVARQHALPRDRARPRPSSRSGSRPSRRRRSSAATRSPSRARRCSPSRRAWAATPSPGISAGHIGPEPHPLRQPQDLRGGLMATTPGQPGQVDREPRAHEARRADAEPGHEGRAVEGARRLPPEPEIGETPMATHAAFMPGAKVEAPRSGVLVASWLTTVDHKRIGILYGVDRLHLLPDRRHRGADHAPAAGAARQHAGERADASTSCSPCTAPRWCSWRSCR